MKRRSSTAWMLILLLLLLFIGNVLLREISQQPHGLKRETTRTISARNALTLTPSPQPTEANLKDQFPPVRLAWFTNVPRDEDMLSVLKWFELFIFHRNEEKGRDLMITLGARGPILQYFLFEVIHDPGSCSAEPNGNQAAYLPGDFCSINEQHPDWFLLDDEGQQILIRDDNDRYFLMDSGNSGWRSFFLDRIRKTQADPNWGGVFLDNVPVTLAFREQGGHLPSAYPDDTSYQAAVQGLIQYLYEGYFQPENKLLFANLVSRRDDAVWATQLNYLDGAMHEGWAIDRPNGYRPPDTWEKHMKLAEQTQALGKTIVLVSQGKREDTILQRFAIASYLLINQGSAYFRFANSDKYREVWLYEDYALNLGAPLGPRYPDGDTWRRDFVNGDVAVNPVTHEVEINIK